MGNWGRSIAPFACVTYVVACGSFSGADNANGEGDGGPAGGIADSAAPPDASLLGDGGADAGGSCPGTAGPRGVRVGTFCIDATEVTRSQYAAFLAAKGGDTAGQPTACANNSSYLPSMDWPAAPGEESHPVRGVDWCDATAFCAWAGKRLCGRIGGGPVAPGDVNDIAISQWYFACTGGGRLGYPYGAAYVATACNGEEARDPPRAAAVGSFPACEGGFAGVFDMSGNAWEWEDACDGADESAQCYIRGGDETQPASTLACNHPVSQPRLNAGRWGFRCCSP